MMSIMHVASMMAILVSSTIVTEVAAQSKSVLHCRYDVSTPNNYWYSKWALTTGCKTQGTAQGGNLDPTLMEYYKMRVEDRGEWFNVVDWANQSSNCRNAPWSTTCMSCSMNMPKFALDNKVVPFGVYDGWWLYPEPGAGCGMCYKIFPRDGFMSPRCKQAKDSGDWTKYESYTECPGNGNSPYISTSQNPWAWNAKVYYENGKPYIIGINVEWYDLDVPLEYGVSYLLQGVSPVDRGNWPLTIQPTPCPVGGNKIEMVFVAKGKAVLDPIEKFFKLQVAGQRIAISKVQIQWVGETKWWPMTRSGNRNDRGYGDADGHFEVNTGGYSRDRQVSIKVFCADGSAPKVASGLVPSTMTCKWQDPYCKRRFTNIQC